MTLETSDQVWAMMVSNARKAMDMQTRWQSPHEHRLYAVKDVSDEKIIISRSRGNPENISKKTLVDRLQQINDSGGVMLADDLTGSVAQKTAIVFLHPDLTWSPDKYSIIAVKTAAQIITQSDKKNTTVIPNDEPGKQKVARNIRKGQKKFRDHLLDAYQGKCCISECAIHDVLEAAHIYDHHLSRINQPENGVLLRSDIHILFDMNLIKITPQTHLIDIAEELRHTEYAIYHGKKVAARTDNVTISDEYLQLKSDAGKIKDEETGY